MVSSVRLRAAGDRVPCDSTAMFLCSHPESIALLRGRRHHSLDCVRQIWQPTFLSRARAPLALNFKRCRQPCPSPWRTHFLKSCQKRKLRGGLSSACHVAATHPQFKQSGSLLLARPRGTCFQCSFSLLTRSWNSQLKEV